VHASVRAVAFMHRGYMHVCLCLCTQPARKRAVSVREFTLRVNRVGRGRAWKGTSQQSQSPSFTREAGMVSGTCGQLSQVNGAAKHAPVRGSSAPSSSQSQKSSFTALTP
jgi:hypothetical protein